MLKRKPIVFFLILLAASSLSSPAFAASKAWYAQPLTKLGFYVFDNAFTQPDFRVTDLSGAQKSRNSLKGKAVLLNFWATWCPPCKEEIPSIDALSKAMKGKNFEVFAVSLGEDAETVRRFITEQKISFPVYLDSRNTLARNYASQGIPTTYILDKDGTFIAGMVGTYDYANPEFIALMDELARR
ncbi:MAG: TlpA disulfide reductase family protein [Spirochaetia bacterium]|jgi:thiol-disulfide isomerase/thioredoxin|nr:TlpA disulfide reductase family protein [Spirochaetales bacterium]MDX9783401.1 TlpA disulfide reductase family protein [Spirochaetia bacterium]